LGFITLGPFNVSTAAGVALGQYAGEGDAIEAALADALANGDRGPYTFSTEALDVKFLKGFAKAVTPPIPPPVVIVSQSIPDLLPLRAGATESVDLSTYVSGATFGVSYSISASSGSLAALGLSFSGTTLSSSALLPGNGVFQLVVSKSGLTYPSNPFTVSVAPVFAITPTYLPIATVGTAYSATLAANGTPPYTWSITADTPDTGSWLTLSSSTGALSGVPGTIETEIVTVQVVDALGNIASRVFSLGVTSGLAVSANGTTIPSAAQIVDATLNIWTVTGGGVVYENGAAAGLSASVILLLWYNAIIYQENSSGAWWSWNGAAWVSVSGDPRTNAGFGVKSVGSGLISTQNGSAIKLIGSAAITTPQGFSGNNKGRDYGWSQVTPAQWQAAVNAAYNGLSPAGKPYGLVNCIRLVVCSAQWMAFTGRDPFSNAGTGYYSVGTDSHGHSIYSGGPGGGLGSGPGHETSGNPANYRALITQQVANINAAGYYALIDLHWGTPTLVSTGQYVLPAGQPAMLGPGDVLFWQSIAQTFGSNPGVMFELYNEPYGQNTANSYFPELVYDASILGSASATGVAYPSSTNPCGILAGYLMMNNFAGSAATVALFGGTDPQTGGKPQCYAVGHQACINAIRAAGATNIIWAGPPNFSGEFRDGSGGNLWLRMGLTDPLHNLGCSWHCYNSAVTSASFDAVQAAGFPVLCTEMGGIDSETSYVNERNKNRGYTWWGWANYNASNNPATNGNLNAAPWAPGNGSWVFPGNGAYTPTGSN
jgi:hypothetical protein